MKKVFIKISVLSIALVIAASCTKTTTAGPTGATGAAGPSLTGNMQGTVTLYDVSGAKQLSPTLLGGDTVVLTNSSSGTVWKTVTNASGDYLFSNISSGTYSTTVSKTGYGSVVTQGIQFVGGGNSDRNYALSVVPATNVSWLIANDTTYTSTGVNYMKLRGAVPTSTSETTVIVFVSIPGTGSTSSTVGNFSTTYTTTIAAGTNKFTIEIPIASLYDLGFTSGNTATAYFASYIIGGTTSASSYVDWTTGQTVYTALSSTPATSNSTVD
jgi:carboxypeptidase family protein